jgi:DNA-binding NarL/FixJ family response regulator
MPQGVYIVEDDFKVAAGIVRSLTSQREFPVVGVANALGQARAELERLDPAIVVIDLQLPDGDGTSLIRWLRGARPRVVLLVFTVFGDEAPVIRAIEAGADGYLLKGCSDVELVHALHQARAGESPISPAIARHLLNRLRRAEGPEAEHEVPLPADRLTAREVEVLRLVAQGFVADEIGQRLGISVNTVRSHIRNVYGKLSVNHQGQAVSAAHRLGYL